MKIDKIVFILLLSCLSFSCGRKETKERMKTYADAEKEFVGSLTKTDSITVLEMSQKCMDSLKEGNIEAALGMLYVVKDGEAVRLTNENAENLKKHFLSTNYNQMSTILLPEPIVAGYGVPKEILMVADSRKLIMGIVSPFYLILESLGIFLRNKNMTKMVIDFYDDGFSAGLPYREFAGLQKCIDA